MHAALADRWPLLAACLPPHPLTAVPYCALHALCAGYCGLVKVQDEDLVRPDPGAANAQPPAAAVQPPLAPSHRRQRSSSSGMHTPPSMSPRASPGSSPFKPAPGAAPREQQPAALLTEQAAALLQQRGRLAEAQALLHTALLRCPLADTQLAGRICDLTLEAEREAAETPTHSADPTPSHSRHGSAEAQGGEAAAGGSAGSGEAAALVRQALAAAAAGERRRAEAALQQALAACPEPGELRRRAELLLVMCKGQG